MPSTLSRQQRRALLSALRPKSASDATISAIILFRSTIDPRDPGVVLDRLRTPARVGRRFSSGFRVQAS